MTTLLAIDAGNTRIKWGIRRSGRWSGLAACATGDRSALAAGLSAAPAADRVLIANVAGARVGSDIEQALAANASRAEFIASRSAQCGVRSSYDDPGQLGCDRWAALIAARRRVGGACLVVNAGTALTVDALTDDGLFLGGIIVPGIELMCRALAEHTAGLARQPGEVRFFPANTGDAIMSGAVHGCCGAVERMARFMRESGQEPLRAVLSGGAAEALGALFDLEVDVVPNLVLEGLAAIGEESC